MEEQIPNIINTLIQSNEEEINELKKQIKIEKMDAEKFNILYMFQIEQILGSIFSDNDKIQFIYIHYDTVLNVLFTLFVPSLYSFILPLYKSDFTLSNTS